ncbi:phage tail tip fiber protein, partial [Pseudomonas kitaguniensis]|uniref:phage tail tip fiber protein n=1 Tax=Pseudomonas kitaguniensis TaxID=2607908 RepID=UPI003D0671B7
ASSNESLRASVRGDDGAGELAGAIKAWDSTAAISTEKKVRATEIEAQTKVSETLQSSIGQTSASVQTVSETVVQLNGKVLSQVTMKAQTIVDGRKVATGFAFGSNGEQSEFLIMAQRMAVVNEIDGKVVPMFVI